MKIKIISIAILVIVMFNKSYAQIPDENSTIYENTDSILNLYDELDELVITAKKDVVKSDGTKLTYDLEQDDSSKGQTLLDALRKIPLITVDGQDNIYIKGNQNFKIYVNGKEEPMLTANAKTVFKAMPAESVSKIEVITEPGAKYDAEGAGGVLNLITERKQSKDGYTGSTSISATAQNFGANLYGRIKKKRITADASINYMNNDLQRQHLETNQQTIDKDSDNRYKQSTNMLQDISFNYLGANMNMSWEFTDKDLFTFGADITDVDVKIHKLDNLNQTFNRSGIIQNSLLQRTSGSMLNLSTSANTSYRRLFSDKGNTVTVGYRFNFNKNPWNLRYKNENLIGDSQVSESEINQNITFQREHTITADFVNPFADGKHNLETGIKCVIRRNEAVTKQLAGNEFENMSVIEDGDTRQVQDIYAAYASYTGNFNIISFTAGLRYEHSRMGLDFLKDDAADFRRSLDDVVPDAAVTYIFGPSTNLRLAYQMRISRPTISQLNPTPFKLTQSFVKLGNPYLDSEKFNSLSLTYSNFGRILGGNVSISCRQSNNTIEDINYFKDGVWYDTYANFGKNRSLELSGFLNINISPALSLSVNGDINYTSIKSGDGSVGNHGWNGNYGANINYTDPVGIRYTLYGGQSTGAIQLQGSWSGWHYYGLSLSRSFLKEKRLTLAINASNFFTKYTNWHSKTTIGNTTAVSNGKNRAWNLGITITYNFGYLKEQVKKTGADIYNDDTKKTNSKGGGIGL